MRSLVTNLDFSDFTVYGGGLWGVVSSLGAHTNTVISVGHLVTRLLMPFA